MSIPSDPDALPDAAVRALSRARYRRRAADYDASCGPTWPIRERCIASLRLQPGESVLDVGCGTGLSLPRLVEAVGPGGRVVGLDQSPEMLAQARARVAAAGWTTQVELVEGPAQALPPAWRFDALLFHYTHDVLQSAAALDRLLACARPGARVAVAGVKFFPAWLAPLNAWVYLKNRAYNGGPGQLRAPWRHLAARLEGFQRTPTQWGMGYLGLGRLPDPSP